MFDLIGFVPKSTFLPIAQFNFFQLSKSAIGQNYSGFAGHYALLTKSRLKKHRELKQKLATGYVNSKMELQKIVNRLLSQPLNDKE
jgi:hypothetical protein